MKNAAILCALLFFFSNCGKDDAIVIKEIQQFSDDHFVQFSDFPLRAETAELLEDGSILVVGTGSEVKDITRNPFFLKIGPANEIANATFLEEDSLFIYRPIDLIPTQDGNFIYLNQSGDGAEFPHEINIDVRKLTVNGEIQWKKRIDDSYFHERGLSITQLPNGDYIFVTYGNHGFSIGSYLVVRISKEGEEIWSKTIEDDEGLRLRKILYLPNDNSIVILNEKETSSTDNRDIKLTKIDVDGNVLITKIVSESTPIISKNSYMKLLNDGTILLYYTNSGEVKLKNLSADLTELSSTNFNEIESNWILDVIETSDGALVLLSKSYEANNRDKVLLSKLNCGEVVWKKGYGGTSNYEGLSVKERENNNLVVIGRTNHKVEVSGTFNLFLMETDSEGNPN